MPPEPGRSAFRFLRFWVQGLSFETKAPEPREPGEKRPSMPGITLTFSVRTTIDPSPLKADVTFSVQVEGDRKWQPYDLMLAVSGQFAGSEGVTVHELDAFAKLNAPVILFPYVREIIHRTTSDGRYGPIQLHPMNLSQYLESEKWKSQPTAEASE